uniref:Uncharacterized protein n=1 Tax=Coturnix japonica TaxID=93934 RepID=A0A8C2TH90_COTJA
ASPKREGLLPKSLDAGWPLMIGVAKSLPAGWVLRYSLAEATASFLSYVLEAFRCPQSIICLKICLEGREGGV